MCGRTSARILKGSRRCKRMEGGRVSFYMWYRGWLDEEMGKRVR